MSKPSIETAVRKPAIVISAAECDRLIALAESASRRMPEVAQELLVEMDRAEVVDSAALPADVIGLYTPVTYATDTGETHRVMLVLPRDADIGAGRVSILTPVGVALIGLAEGQSMDWTTRDGRTHRLKVLKVEPAEAAPGD
jgi:regulator of nucleoside diphosphate kinase